MTSKLFAFRVATPLPASAEASVAGAYDPHA